MQAARDARDAPEADLVEVVGRLAYWMQMGAVLWWLLDRSARASATDRLVDWLGKAVALWSSMRWVPGVSGALRQLDELVSRALLGGGE